MTTERKRRTAKKQAEPKPRSNDTIAFRCPAGWREKICQAAGTDNVSEAVVTAVANQYGLKYRQGDAGRPAKLFAVDVTTPHSEELVLSVFEAFSQPWDVATVKISAGKAGPTFVSCTCDGEVCNSLQIGKRKGVELAREIKAEIDKAAEGLQ